MLGYYCAQLLKLPLNLLLGRKRDGPPITCRMNKHTVAKDVASALSLREAEVSGDTRLRLRPQGGLSPGCGTNPQLPQFLGESLSTASGLWLGRLQLLKPGLMVSLY